MGHSVVGIFQHSGDADLAAAHLREAYTLDEDELDIIGEADALRTGETRAAMSDNESLILYALTGIGDIDPINRRWGDMTAKQKTIVVARSDDPDRAVEIAGEMRRAGAERVDLLPH